MNLTVRDATIDDAPTLADFNVRLVDETEDYSIEPAVALRGVTRALEADRGLRYFVADVDGRPAGMAMFTHEWSDWRDGDIWWLGSVYVDPAHRGRGVFRALSDHVAALAEADPDVRLLRLYVETHNEAARATYERLGFKECEYRVYERPVGRA